ncbi:MAG: 3'(2'),5'-bisphosphate nucleotidase [Thiotrichales bacterium]|nr:3'(2'),5'-bisphosphate nucleotidase [Thiotrichales bacterium]|tara:strand:- start:458 stop:1222 length:765 start_codon:yes stop_codon:yes gene_type:complete
MKPMNSRILSQLINLTTQAGEIIMDLRDNSTNYSIKADNTPLTLADKASHELIVSQLQKLTPNIPILSEESSHIPFSTRKSWNEYWLIDPLDGTRDFIDGSPDFCISIALIRDNYPSFGLIYSPYNKVHYYRLENSPSLKLVNKTTFEILTTKPKRWEKIVVGRYSTNNKGLKEHLKHKTNFETFKHGSALKFCLIAEGIYHYYPKFGRCSEWDTAAGVCILEGAGGKVIDLNNNTLKYNSTKDIISPAFRAIA